MMVVVLWLVCGGRHGNLWNVGTLFLNQFWGAIGKRGPSVLKKGFGRVKKFGLCVQILDIQDNEIIDNFCFCAMWAFSQRGNVLFS